MAKDSVDPQVSSVSGLHAGELSMDPQSKYPCKMKVVVIRKHLLGALARYDYLILLSPMM